MQDKAQNSSEINTSSVFIPQIVKAPSPQVLANNLLDQVVAGFAFHIVTADNQSELAEG